MALLTFYCDESYDSSPPNNGLVFHAINDIPHVPKAYVVGGFLANERTWGAIGDRWREENKRVGVSRYHGAHVNAKTYEFEGWDKDRQQEYSINLLTILKDQQREIHAVSAGLFPREYEQIISEKGRERLGCSYIVCFKSCVAMIAQEMEIRSQFGPDDKFAVILDRNDHESEAVDIFYALKDTTTWPYHRRLATCAPGGWEDHVELQPADLIAYETFRILGEKYEGREGARPALRSMFKTNGFLGYYFGVQSFKDMKYAVENTECVPNGFVIQFPAPAEEE